MGRIDAGAQLVQTVVQSGTEAPRRDSGQRQSAAAVGHDLHRQPLVKMPYGVCKRSLLRREQEDNATQLQ